MARLSRDVDIFNLSFLDVLCCGLGAIVILLMLAFQSVQDWDAARRAVTVLRGELAMGAQERDAADASTAKLEDWMKTLENKGAEVRTVLKGLQREADELKKLNFVGIHTRKVRVLLVVDLSASIFEGGFETHLLEITRALVDTIPKGSEFGLLGFRGPDFFPSWPAEGQLETATPSSREAANSDLARWVSQAGQRGCGSTPTAYALARAFAYEDLEAVFLLTDGAPDDFAGAPTDGKTQAFLDKVAALQSQRRNKLEIHCIGLGPTLFQQPAFRGFLRDLADANSGGFLGFY